MKLEGWIRMIVKKARRTRMPTRLERLTSCCFLWVLITSLETWVKWNDGQEWQWREQEELGEREGLPTGAERLPLLVVTWEFSTQDLKAQVTYTPYFSHLSQTLTKCSWKLFSMVHIFSRISLLKLRYE